MTAWYQDGLRFECTRCGNCCTGAPGFVWVDDAELNAIAELRGEPLEHVRGLFTRPVGDRRSLREKANNDCVFYDRREGCTIYAARVSPDFCPFQKDKLCTAREPRPLGCRVYFCDPAYQETGNQITETYLQKLKELATVSGNEWLYAPLHHFLNNAPDEASK